MNKSEIRDFKKFLNERNVLLMFSTCYRQHRLTVNPPTLDEYLEKARVENVIPQAFVYPQKLYGKEFWLSIHDEWIKLIQQSRAEKAESDQLESLGLEIIDVHSRSSCLGLPKNTCSLSLRGGKRFTLNMEDSKRVAKKLSTHMLLTRSRQTADVVLMFNRQKGADGTSGSRCQSGLFPAEYRAAVRDKGLSIVYDKEKGKRIKEVVKTLKIKHYGKNS